jgi:hypothetical protein
MTHSAPKRLIADHFYSNDFKDLDSILKVTAPITLTLQESDFEN